MRSMQGLVLVMALSIVSATGADRKLVHEFHDDLVVRLNKHTFGDAIARTDDYVDHWVVLFCTDWHEPCQMLLQSFRESSARWEYVVNSDIFSSTVRFARVDCGAEKMLCTKQNVHEYPTIIHYRRGDEVEDWLGTDSKAWAKDVTLWIEKQLRITMMPDESLQPATDKSHLLAGVIMTAILALIGSIRIVVGSSDSSAPAQQHMKERGLCNRRANIANIRAQPSNLGVERFLPVEWSLRHQVQL